MRRLLRNLIALAFGLVLGGWIAYANASLTICIPYPCPAPTGPDDSMSKTIGESIPAQSICDQNGKCAYVGASTAYAGETPSGWSSPTSPPSSTTTAPRWSAYSGAGLTTDGQWAADAETAGMSWMTATGAGEKGDAPAASSSGGSQGGGTFYYCATGSPTCWADNNGKRQRDMWTGSYCPAGYTDAGGGNCTLTNAAIVVKPKDGMCNVLRSGNTYSGDPLDPDCAVSTSDGVAASINLNVSGSKVTAAKDGKTATIDTNSTTGTTVVSSSAPAADGVSTVINQTATSAPGIGGGVTVTGAASMTVQGTGALQGSGSSAGLTAADLPTDYMRDATGAQIKSGIDALNQKLDTTGVDSTLSTQSTDLDTAATERKNAVTDVGTRGLDDYGVTWSWSPAVPAMGSCAPFQFSLHQWSWTVDICDFLAIFRQVLGYLLYFAFGFLALDVLTGKKGTA